MKIPNSIKGIVRKNRSDAVSANTGVIPQNAFCENVCHQVFPRGGPVRDQCLHDCRKN